MTPTWRVLVGDVRTRLLSRTNSVQFTRPKVEGFANSDIFVRVTAVRYTPRRSTRVREVSIASDLGSMRSAIGLMRPERQSVFSRRFLNPKKRENRPQDALGFSVGCLPTVEGTPSIAPLLPGLVPVPATKRVFEEGNRRFVNHPHMNRTVIGRIDAPVQVPVRLRALDADTAFTVNQPSEIRKVSFARHGNHYTAPCEDARLRKGVMGGGCNLATPDR